MKILKANGGPLTNFEVLAFLQSRNASKDPAKRVMSKLTPSEYKVFDYLVESAACNQTIECISEFRDKSKEFQLAQAEVVNIINIRPSSEVEIATMIDQWESRMEDRISELVEKVEEVLPPHPKLDNANQDTAVDDDSAEATEEKNETNADVEMADVNVTAVADFAKATEEKNETNA